MIDCRQIPLGRGYFATVDAADYERLSRFRWHALVRKNRRTVYAIRNFVRPDGRRSSEEMQRTILRPADGLFVDHRDGDGLNNRRQNLRESTCAQNCANRRAKLATSSQYLGVSWHKANQKWTAHVCTGGVQQYLGSFGQEIAAAVAYDEAARRIHGEFANPNFSVPPC